MMCRGGIVLPHPVQLQTDSRITLHLHYLNTPAVPTVLAVCVCVFNREKQMSTAEDTSMPGCAGQMHVKEETRWSEGGREGGRRDQGPEGEDAENHSG